MPRVPTYSENYVKPERRPNVYAKGIPNADVAGAGVGRAMQQAGNTIMQSGDLLAQRALEIKEEDDRNLAIDTKNSFIEDKVKFLYDPEEGLFNRKGKNALGSYKEATEWFDEKTGEYAESIESEGARRKFKELIASKKETFIKTVSSYEAREREQYKTAVAEATVNTAVMETAKNPYDEGLFQDNKQSVTEVIEENMKGMGEEAIDLAKTEAISKMRIAVIDELISLEDGKGAKAYFTAHEKDILGTSRDNVRDKVNESNIYAFLQEKGPEIFDKYGVNGEESAMKYVEKNYSGKREERLKSHLQSIYIDERRYKKERERKAYEAKVSAIQNAGSLAKAKAIAGKDGKLLNLAEDMYTEVQFPKENDMDKYLEMDLKFEKGEIESIEDLLPYKPYLTKRTWITARTNLNSILAEQGEEVEEPEKYTGLSTTGKRLVKEIINDWDMTPAAKGALWDMIDGELKKEADPEKGLSINEEVKIGERIIAENASRRHWFGSKKKDVHGFQLLSLYPDAVWDDDLQTWVIKKDGQFYEIVLDDEDMETIKEKYE